MMNQYFYTNNKKQSRFHNSTKPGLFIPIINTQLLPIKTFFHEMQIHNTGFSLS